MATAPYGDVEYADPGYLDADGNQASKSGKPGQKRYPIDAGRVQAAWSYINQAKNAAQYTPEQLSAIKGRIKAAMKAHGHDVAADAGDGARRAAPMPYTRSFALEDISIRSGGDGRTVEAYAAIFNTPAAIRDADGEYDEVIDPVCFNRAIGLARRAGGGFSTPVFFNHGMTLFHTPSELAAMPIGIAEEIRADSRGLFTRSRYNTTPLADAALENIRAGSISAYSFSGAFKKSDPELRRGQQHRADSKGNLPTVRRIESTLREYGPTPFPAYAGAEVVGVRAEQAAMLLSNLGPGEFERLVEFYRSGTRLDSRDSDVVDVGDPPEPECGTPDDDSGPAADDPPPTRHSTRSPKAELKARKAELLARRAQFLIRQGERKHA